ncbi:MAG: hypothetical protein ACUVQP_00135 [Bacteroidales bacterium]
MFIKLESFDYRVNNAEEYIRQGKWEIFDGIKIKSPGRDSPFCGTGFNLGTGLSLLEDYVSIGFAFKVMGFTIGGPVISINLSGVFRHTTPYVGGYEFASGTITIEVTGNGAIHVTNAGRLASVRDYDLALPGTINRTIGKWQHLQIRFSLLEKSPRMSGKVYAYVNESLVGIGNWEFFPDFWGFGPAKELLTSTAGIHFVQIRSDDVIGYDATFVDDLYVTNNPDVQGDYHIGVLTPRYDITTGWDSVPSGSHWSTLDERATDESDYIISSTLGSIDQFQYEPAGLTDADEVAGYQHVVSIKKPGVGEGKIRVTDSIGVDRLIYPANINSVTYTAGYSGPALSDPTFLNSFQVRVKVE